MIIKKIFYKVLKKLKLHFGSTVFKKCWAKKSFKKFGRLFFRFFKTCIILFFFIQLESDEKISYNKVRCIVFL